MPVLFFVDAQLDDEARLDDVTNITLSYTFFEVENPREATKTVDATLRREGLN